MNSNRNLPLKELYTLLKKTWNRLFGLFGLDESHVHNASFLMSVVFTKNNEFNYLHLVGFLGKCWCAVLIDLKYMQHFDNNENFVSSAEVKAFFAPQSD